MLLYANQTSSQPSSHLCVCGHEELQHVPQWESHARHDPTQVCLHSAQLHTKEHWRVECRHGCYLHGLPLNDSELKDRDRKQSLGVANRPYAQQSHGVPSCCSHFFPRWRKCGVSLPVHSLNHWAGWEDNLRFRFLLSVVSISQKKVLIKLAKLELVLCHRFF